MSKQFELSFEGPEEKLAKLEAEYARTTGLPPIREGGDAERTRLMEEGIKNPEVEIRRRTLLALEEKREEIEDTYGRKRTRH